MYSGTSLSDKLVHARPLFFYRLDNCASSFIEHNFDRSSVLEMAVSGAKSYNPPLPENIFPQDLTSKATRQSLGGKSLVPLLDGEIDNIRDYAVGGHYNREWYLRTERWTYLFPLDEGSEPELYDRESDPGEQDNLIEYNPELAKKLELSLLRSVHSLRKQTD